MHSSIETKHQPGWAASRRPLASSLLRTTFAIAAAIFTSTTAAWAEGFPGKGDRYLYSEALPHYNLGNRYLAKEWYEKAVEKYLDAIHIYEFDADVYTNLSVAYRKLGNMEGAEAACRKAVELNDKDWAAWSNLGNLLMLQEKLPESYKCFTRAMMCKIPAAEKQHIESSIDGMKKVMNARGLTIDGKSLASPAVTTSAPASKKTTNGNVATTPRKPPAANRSNQSSRGNDSGLDVRAYDQWLGDK